MVRMRPLERYLDGSSNVPGALRGSVSRRLVRDTGHGVVTCTRSLDLDHASVVRPRTLGTI
jgi:hypothetical protein